MLSPRRPGVQMLSPAYRRPDVVVAGVPVWSRRVHHTQRCPGVPVTSAVPSVVLASPSRPLFPVSSWRPRRVRRSQCRPASRCRQVASAVLSVVLRPGVARSRPPFPVSSCVPVSRSPFPVSSGVPLSPRRVRRFNVVLVSRHS